MDPKQFYRGTDPGNAALRESPLPCCNNRKAEKAGSSAPDGARKPGKRCFRSGGAPREFRIRAVLRSCRRLFCCAAVLRRMKTSAGQFVLHGRPVGKNHTAVRDIQFLDTGRLVQQWLFPGRSGNARSRTMPCFSQRRNLRSLLYTKQQVKI